jgi:small-conductance mechanosensitive channel
MKEFRKAAIIVPAMVLVILLVVLFVTRGTMEQLAFMRRGAAGQAGLVDQSPYETAQTLAGTAVSAEEQTYAQEAARLADHEVDQAFAQALRQAALQQRVLTGDAARLQGRVEDLKKTVRDDQAQVELFTTAAKAANVAGTAGDDLDVAKAQLQLDTDELTDAESDLARESGDQRMRIQQELNAREAMMKAVDDPAGSGPKMKTTVAAVRQHTTIWGQGKTWLEQRSRVTLLGQARTKAADDAKRFAEEHDRLAHGDAGAGLALATGSNRVKTLQAMAGRRAVMSILDDRLQTEQQLATVYVRWQQQVWVQHRILGYLITQSMAWVAFLGLVTTLVAALARKLVVRMTTEPRQALALGTILTLAVEIVGIGLGLLVVFGVPQQISTILGLVTAGLTVVFQDFILAFFGWFVLMGRNGIRVGDWVEIDGVGGEVAEIGLFRTLLLEAGNWTSSGHPTGRRVTFTNSFAIRGKFFNFSTHGQWMWDEIQLNVAANANAYELIVKIQEAVERETATDTAQAEREWQTVTRNVGLSQFTAKPTVDLRPAASGVGVVVRFVTRADERFETRNKLYEALVGLMEGTERPTLEGAVAGPLQAGNT